MYGNDFTLFNYHLETDKWYTTVFTDTDLIAHRAASSTTHGTSNGDSVEILVNTAPDRSASNKKYLSPKAYAKCADPGAHFTFAPERDFLIAGDHGSTGPIEDSDDIGLYSEMNDEHDDVYLVTSAVFYSLIPHFEIGGK